VEENAFIMEAMAGVVFLVVGLRLFGLSRRTRQAPEYFISLTFLIWAAGYALYDIPYALTTGEESVAPAFAYSSLLAFNLGNVAFALFTRVVFRPRQRGALWLVVAIAVCEALGAAGSAWVGDWEQVDPHANPGYWPQTIGGLAPALWMGIEGLTHYVRARLRVRIGLCEPLICHQFLLWGLAGALWAVLELVVVAQDFVYLSAGDWSEALGIVNGLLEIVPIGMIWLVFYAPPAYRRWVEGAPSS